MLKYKANQWILNVTKYEKFIYMIDMVSKFTLKVIFKKLPLVEDWWKKYPQLPEKAIKLFLVFLITHLCDIYFTQNIVIDQMQKKVWEPRGLLLSLLKRLTENVIQFYCSNIFYFGEVIFHFKIHLCYQVMGLLLLCLMNS